MFNCVFPLKKYTTCHFHVHLVPPNISVNVLKQTSSFTVHHENVRYSLNVRDTSSFIKERLLILDRLLTELCLQESGRRVFSNTSVSDWVSSGNDAMYSIHWTPSFSLKYQLTHSHFGYFEVNSWVWSTEPSSSSGELPIILNWRHLIWHPLLNKAI